MNEKNDGWSEILMDHRNAIILNFLVWGAGYLYLKRRTVFAWISFAGYLFSFLSIFYLFLNFDKFVIPNIFVFIGHLFISLAMAWDVSYEKLR